MELLMTRCGIGPEFIIVSVLSGILTGWLTYSYPGWLTIHGIPYWFLAIPGTGFLVVGTVVYAVLNMYGNKEQKLKLASAKREKKDTNGQTVIF
jgi:hypothetical protein